jgi:hypothetical protein
LVRHIIFKARDDVAFQHLKARHLVAMPSQAAPPAPAQVPAAAPRAGSEPPGAPARNAHWRAQDERGGASKRGRCWLRWAARIRISQIARPWPQLAPIGLKQAASTSRTRLEAGWRPEPHPNEDAWVALGHAR